MLNNNDVFNDGFHYWMQKYLILISVMQEKKYGNLQKNRKKVKKKIWLENLLIFLKEVSYIHYKAGFIL